MLKYLCSVRSSENEDTLGDNIQLSIIALAFSVIILSNYSACPWAIDAHISEARCHVGSSS